MEQSLPRRIRLAHKLVRPTIRPGRNFQGQNTRVQRTMSSSSRAYKTADARWSNSPANTMKGATKSDVSEDEADGISPPCTCDRGLSAELDCGVHNLDGQKLA